MRWMKRQEVLYHVWFLHTCIWVYSITAQGKEQFCKRGSKLFDYGACVNDTLMPLADDGFQLLDLEVPFKFFGETYQKIWICTNGILSLDGGLDVYSPLRFPQSRKIISPYWADVDTREGIGKVLYRQVTSGSQLKKATGLVRSALKGISTFNAAIAIIVTWHNVTFYGSTTRPGQGLKKNTFQAAIISDGDRSYGFFIYDKLTWTKAKYGGGVRPQIGFDAGDGQNYYSVPGFSFTDDAILMSHVTNIGGPLSGFTGCWLSQFNLVNDLAPIMKCLQSKRCCVMQGNVYISKLNCSHFEQRDYLNHPASPGVIHKCPGNTKFSTSPTKCVCVIDVQDCRNE